MKRALALVPMAVAAAVAVFFYLGLGRDPAALPSALIDRPVPAFELPPLLADRPGLAKGDLVGQPHLVNVFASWCVPCRAEHPVISDLADSGAVQVVAINYKDKPADARRWLTELGNPYARIGVDESGRVAIDWGVYGVPETYLVDAAGQIRYRHVGPLTAAVVRGELLPRLAALR